MTRTRQRARARGVGAPAAPRAVVLVRLGTLGRGAAEAPAHLAHGVVVELPGRLLRLDAVLDQHDLNGIIVATPAFTHAEMACRALAAGRHVYVEKPLAMSLDEAKKAVKNATSLHITSATPPGDSPGSAAASPGTAAGLDHRSRWDSHRWR